MISVTKSVEGCEQKRDDTEKSLPIVLVSAWRNENNGYILQQERLITFSGYGSKGIYHILLKSDMVLLQNIQFFNSINAQKDQVGLQRCAFTYSSLTMDGDPIQLHQFRSLLILVFGSKLDTNEDRKDSESKSWTMSPPIPVYRT